MTRALTSPELVTLRTPGHQTRLYLAILRPAIVFQARVNQAFSGSSSHDMVAQVAYDTVTTGAYTDIEIDMDVAIGSTAGADDIGYCRIRKAPTSSILYVGEGSELAWADNLYITIYKSWSIWPRHVKISGSGSTVLMDYDVAYTNQNTACEPDPILGPDCVLWKTTATATTTFDSSASSVEGGTIASKLWTCSEAFSVGNETTNTPGVTFDAVQVDGATVKCVLTSAAGKSSASYRNVWVFDDDNMPLQNFQLVSCSGDMQSGGWSFTVRMLDDATRTEIRDRAKVVLFARDYVANQEVSVGTESGRENILAVGWIAGESITNDIIEGGNVEFTVQGPRYWLEKISGFPAGVRDTKATAAKWTEFDGLTVDKGLHHLIHWRTTLWRCCDWYKTGDTRRATAIEAGGGSLWSQLVEMSARTILADPICDRFGRLYTEVPVNLTPIASRSSVPTVMTLQNYDYLRPVIFDRVVTREAAQVVLSGVYATPTSTKTFYSLSPGHVQARHGDIRTYERLLLSSQAQSNELAGMISSTANAEFPSIPLTMSAINRVFDIAPRQRAYVSISSSANERGVGYTGYVIPRSISYEMDNLNGYLRTTIEFMQQCSVDLATNGDPPGQVIFSPSFPNPPILIPPITLPPLTSTTEPAYVLIREGNTGIWMWTQETGAWTNLTVNQDATEKVQIGSAVNPAMVAQKFGNGGGIYCLSSAGDFYAGDVVNGLYKLYDLAWMQQQVNPSGVDGGAYWEGLAVNHFTGQVAALASYSVGSFTRDKYLFRGMYSLGSPFNIYPGANPSVSSGRSMGISSSGKYAFFGIGAIFQTSTFAAPFAIIPPYTDGAFWPTGSYGKSAVLKDFSSGYLITSPDDFATLTTRGVAPFGSGAINQLDAKSDLSLIIAGTGTGLSKSTDYGVTFSALGFSFPNTMNGVHWFGGSNWVAVSTGGTSSSGHVYISNDDGLNWTDITGDLYTQITGGLGGSISIVQSALIVGSQTGAL